MTMEFLFLHLPSMQNLCFHMRNYQSISFRENHLNMIEKWQKTVSPVKSHKPGINCFFFWMVNKIIKWKYCKNITKRRKSFQKNSESYNHIFRWFCTKKENSSTREEKLQALKDVQSSYDSAVNEAFGLWKNHDNSISVDDYVRNMRKGRQFDIR